MTRIFNRHAEREKRRALRNNMTPAEKLLWERIRRRQIRNKRFLRQFGVNKFVIDFYCPEIKLGIEVDGDTHITKDEIDNDKNRQNEIENFGIRILRFRNKEVFENMDDVILKILSVIDGTPLNPPFCKGGK